MDKKEARGKCRGEAGDWEGSTSLNQPGGLSLWTSAAGLLALAPYPQDTALITPSN